MRPPEYWEPDEVHEQYREFMNTERLREAAAEKPPRSDLAKALDRARGRIETEDDMRNAINFGNKLAAMIKSKLDA